MDRQKIKDRKGALAKSRAALLSFFEDKISFKKFKRNQKGALAPIMALLALPLVGLVAAAIDISSINSARSELQDATDAAALAAARTGNFATQASKKAADETLMANLRPGRFSNVQTSVSDSDGDQGHQINVGVSAQISTYFGGLVGRSNIDILANASAVTGTKGAEIVFVLDTTASMASNSKIQTLKTSVNSVLSGMVDSHGVNVNSVKVGIVPFNTQVRIVPDTSANYVDWGVADNYEYCNYADHTRPIWPQCPMFWYNLDALCISAPNEDECRQHAVFYDRPIYGNSSGYYYEQIAKSFVQTGATFHILSHQMVYKWTNSAWTLISSNETGDHYGWVGGTSTLETDVQTSENGQNNASQVNVAPTYVDTNGVTRNFNSLAPFYYDMRYFDGTGTLNGTPVGDVWYANGYGAAPAKSWNYTIYGNGVSRRTKIPATNDQKDKWEGCFIDRNQNYDVSATSPIIGTTNSYYYARRCQDLPLEPILGLTTDISAAKTKIDSLQPAGFTNITIGVQWGIEVLSNSAPFSEGSDWGDKKHGKFMVLITDGYNNKNRFTTNVSDVDKRTELACENAKAKGITMFVVRLEEGDTQLLKKCASGENYFYDLSSASGLSDAMKNIFTSINDLRIVE